MIKKKIQTKPQTPKFCFGFFKAKLGMEGKVNQGGLTP